MNFQKRFISEHALKTLTISSFINSMDTVETALLKVNPEIANRLINIRKAKELKFFRDPRLFIYELVGLLKELNGEVLVEFLTEFISLQDTQGFDISIYENLV